MDNMASEFLYPDPHLAPEKRISDAKYEDNFIIEDLLNFPAEDGLASIDGRSEMVVSCDSSSGANTADVGPAHEVEFCVPYEDLAELEWLSNFVEETFSSEDLQKLQLIQGIKARTNAPSESHQYRFQPETARSGPIFRPEYSVRAKARSKRPCATSGSWNSCILAPEKLSAGPDSQKKKESGPEGGGGEGRRCLHCATEKTPQWRTGPMGPKTLCNACGVRYKSGRLVPEYRPASSPTFVTTRHSNSHRKVVELRRQKEMMLRAQQQQHQLMNHDMMFDEEDYVMIHQHVGPILDT